MTADPVATELTTADGYVLGGYRFAAQAPLKGRVVVAGATAVPQEFYRRFAQFAAARGFDVLTFDYRGIGRSRHGTLKGFRMDLLDWGRQDLAAAVDAMADPQLPLFVVGHSQGGHAFGLTPNHARVAGFYVFGAGAGWHGYMPLGERLRVLAIWKVVLPVLTWWKGYCPWKLLGLGEDLPVDAYRQWRRWCQYPHYFFDDPAMRGIEQAYAAVRTPMVAANALDDLWALPAARDAFVGAYCNAPLTRRNLDPSRVGGKIGHMGYFRTLAEPYWEEVLTWFVAQPGPLAQA
ncbi:alpha/beta fold hydrolase [Thermomonas sp.]|uniref:alpha/beta hydrolase family protein n=1 Tax=Thermomonas sp. TaxID=1971895 RepID=UPI002637B693|nr:alpha/beta fold hydrolase [Thermomonas sp.]